MNHALWEMAKTACMQTKQSFVPAAPPGAQPGMPPGAPPGAPPGMPPMDPSMMGGMPPGAPPGAPPGMPPMDPSMMGGMPPGAPPMDPSMMGGMPPPPPPPPADPSQQPQPQPQQPQPAEGGKKPGGGKANQMSEILHLLAESNRSQKILTKLVGNMYHHQGLPMPKDLLDDDSPAIPKADDVVKPETPQGQDAMKTAQLLADRLDASLAVIRAAAAREQAA